MISVATTQGYGWVKGLHLFWHELRRRSVLRMASLYLVAGWVVVQVAGELVPMFDGPAWLARRIVEALALGFLPAMVFCWVYELTPDGLKRQEEVDRDASITRSTGRRITWITAVMLVAGLVVLGARLLWFDDDAGPAAAAVASTPAAPAQREPLFVYLQMSKDLGYETVMRTGFRHRLQELLSDRYDIEFHEGRGLPESFWQAKDKWRDIADEIVGSYPGTAFLVTFGSDASSAMIEFDVGKRLAALPRSKFRGHLIVGVTDPMRAGYARQDSMTGVPLRAAVRYGSGANDWAGTILRAFDASRLQHKPALIYAEAQKQDEWVAQDLHGSALNGEQIEIIGPLPGELKIEDLMPDRVYFAWFALDELVDHFSHKLARYLIVPSTFTPQNVRNFGVVVGPIDAEIGAKGADYLRDALIDGTPLDHLPTRGPDFHIWINCSAVERKQIPLSPTLRRSDVMFVADENAEAPREDCIAQSPAG